MRVFKAAFRSWQTTATAAGKFLIACGMFVVAGTDNNPDTVANIEPVIGAMLALWAVLDFSQGFLSRDNTKSDQDVGIRR